MRRLILSVAVGFSAAVSCFAGEAPAFPLEAPDKVPLNVFTFNTSYTGRSEINFTSKGQGRGDAFRYDVQYIRRGEIQGGWYWGAGVAYERLEFGGPAHGFLPGSLQTVNLPIGVSYFVDNEVGFLFQVRPGFYFEQEISSGAFDIPVVVGGGIPIIEGELYGIWGVGALWHRRYPVIPVIGLKWKINDRVDLHAYLPEPRLEVKLTDSLRTFVGGEVISNSYKVGNRQDPKLSGTIMDYEDYRVGGGIVYSPSKNWDLLVAGGCSILRNMYYWRANQLYRSEPAPYVRVQLTAAF